MTENAVSLSLCWCTIACQLVGERNILTQTSDHIPVVEGNEEEEEE